MDLLLRSALPLSVNLNRYATKVATHIKFPPRYGGGFTFTTQIFLEQVHSARSSCTADTRPLNGFENGPNLAENRIEYFFLQHAAEIEIPSICQRTGSANFAKVTVK